MALDRLTQITSSGISSTSTITVSAIAGVITATRATVGLGITLSDTQINVGSATTIHSGGFRIGSSDLHSTGITLNNINVSGIVTSSGGIVVGTGGTIITTTSGGNIGIGTTNPTAKLEVKQTSLRQGIRVQHENNDSTLRLYVDSSNSTAAVNASYVSTGSYLPLTFLTSDTERVRITSNGNLGIGITNPSTIFHIRQPADSNGITISHATRIGKWRLEHSGVNSENFAFIQNNGTSDAASYVAGRDVHYWLTNGIERMYLSSSGNLGIGTNNPSGATVDIFAGGTTSGFSLLRISNLADGASAGSLGLQKFGSAAASYGPYSANNVGIDAVYTQFNLGTQTSHPLVLYTNNNERVRINSGGLVGIGTNNPTNHLSVRGTIETLADSNDLNSSTEGGQLILRAPINQSGTKYRFNIDNYYGTPAGQASSIPNLRIFREDDSTATNGVVLFNIDSSGRVNTPSQPSGAWYLNVSAGGVRSVSIRKNIGNCISSVGGGNGSNGSVGRFTAPVSGAYLISLFASAVGASSQCLMSVYGSWTSATNNVYAGQEVFDCRVTRPPEDGGGWSQVFYFNATDYWEIDWYRPGAPTAYIDSGMTMNVTVHLLG